MNIVGKKMIEINKGHIVNIGSVVSFAAGLNI